MTKLYSLQDKVLKALSDYSVENEFPFNFSGGTALVRFFAKRTYRVSYDLDFFSIYSIKSFNFIGLESFLKGIFNEVISINCLQNSTPTYRINIYENNTALKIEFIEDLFSGSFEGKKMDNLNLNIEPVYAIYTRKIWALVSSVNSEGKAWNRVKDLIDLMHLETLHSNFETFLKSKFKEISIQNGIDIPIGKIQAYLNFVEEVMLKNYDSFSRLINEEYKSIYSLEEVIKWIEKKKLALKQI